MSSFTNISTGSVYTCVSQNCANFYRGDKAEVIRIDHYSDLIEVKRLQCLGTYYIPISEFENKFVYMSADNASSYERSLDAYLSQYEPTCECGAHKAYGKDCALFMHSRWCKLFVDDKTKKEGQ